MRERGERDRGRVYYTLCTIVCRGCEVCITGKARIMYGIQTTALPGDIGGSSGRDSHNDFQCRIMFLSLFPSTAATSNDEVHTHTQQS